MSVKQQNMIHNTYLLDGEEPAKKLVVCWERSEKTTQYN